jgi:hypothetical protein
MIERENVEIAKNYVKKLKEFYSNELQGLPEDSFLSRAPIQGIEIGLGYLEEVLNILLNGDKS